MTGESSGLRGGNDEPDQELVVGFWTLVLFVKVAVLAIGLGVIVLAFTDLTVLGLALVGVGAYVTARWVLTYRRLRGNHDAT